MKQTKHNIAACRDCLTIKCEIRRECPDNQQTKKGIVVSSGKKVCEVSGLKCHTWRIKR